MTSTQALDLFAHLADGEFPDDASHRAWCDTLCDAIRTLNAEPDGMDRLRAAWPVDRLPIIADYFCVRLIDAGVAGTVYRAVRFAPDPQWVAIKIIRTADKELQERFLTREVPILQRLDHDYVSRFHDAGSLGGALYLVMELVDGMPLDEYVAEHAHTLEDRLAIFERACRAVAYLHEQGVVHRDLKPKHILVDDDGAPHLVDFGLSTVRSEDWPTEIRRTQTRLGRIMGTVKYMSPEQAWGGLQRIDQRSDVWALGVMLFELATDGDYPFDLDAADGLLPADALLRRIQTELPKPPKIRHPWLASGLGTLIRKSLAPEPEQRFESAAELADDLHRLRQRHAIRSRPWSIPYRLKRLWIGMALHARIALWAIILFATTAGLAVTSHVGGVQWVVNQGDYSVATLGRLMHAERVYGSPDFVVVGIGDDTRMEVPRLAREIGIPEVTRDIRSWRALHGHLMTRLATAQPRLVVWDYFFRSRRAADARFVDGVKALDSAGIPVLLAVTDYDEFGIPAISPSIYQPLRDIIHHGWILAHDMVLRPGEFVMSLRRDDQAQPSLALAAFGALVYPGARTEVNWPTGKDNLMLHYRLRDGAAYRSELDPVNLTFQKIQKRPSLGVRPGDTLGVKSLELTPLATWQRRTVPYEHLLTASDNELCNLLTGKIVLVADTRSPSPLGIDDRHDVRYPTGIARSVPGGYLLGDAIEGLLNNRYLRSERYLTTNSFTLILGMTAAGLLLGLTTAAKKACIHCWPRRIFLAVPLVIACGACMALVTTKSHGGIEMAMGVAALCLGTAASLAIEFSRRRFIFARAAMN